MPQQNVLHGAESAPARTYRTYRKPVNLLIRGLVLLGCACCGIVADPVRAQQDCLKWRLPQLNYPTGTFNNQVAIYDSFRGVVLAVDGHGHAHEWNGMAWARIADALPNLECLGMPCAMEFEPCTVGKTSSMCQPNPVLWHASDFRLVGTGAFDAHRRVCVIFDINDTIREWNGQTWVLKQPDPSPGSIIRAQMFYHPGRRTILMYGGIHAGMSHATSELWEWDGTNWTQIFSATNPPGRFLHGQAFDESRNVFVIFGGRSAIVSGIVFYDDLWEWDGTDWHQKFPPPGDPSPGIRFDHTMAYDSSRKVVVMAGGNNFGADLNDVWDWDGMSWRQRAPQPETGAIPAPIPNDMRRRYPAYDSSRKLFHMIGGTGGIFHWALEHPGAPQVAVGPVSQRVDEGEPVAFSVTTVPPTGVEFQWRRNGIPIPGATTAGYAIQAATVADEGVYDVQVSFSGHDPFPPCGVVLSAPAALRVDPALPADLNGDGTVDLIDFADFATMFGGPQ